MTFISDETFLKIKAHVHLRKLLQREKQGYQSVLHRRVGVGLTFAEFDAVVKELVASGWCFCKEGKQGGILITFNEVFEKVNVPGIEQLNNQQE